MTQYNVIKSKHPDAILLFRVGDFYETFGEDAIITSKILGIVLTNRANGSSKIELSGFPHHSLETYLPKLVRAGKRVAICDQLEDPKKTKGIVKRGVTELVTPGVAFNDLVLESKRNNFLASLYYSNNQKLGISFLDVSTGEFLLAEGDEGYIKKLIQGLNPSEIIFQKSKSNHVNNNYKETIHLFTLDDWVYSEDYAIDLLKQQFKTKSLKGFGIDKLKAGMIASGAILHYLNETYHNKKNHITSISRIDQQNYVWMDQFTINNLELFSSLNNEHKATLVNILDNTSSPMGSRLIRRWIALPLRNVKKIVYRQNIVEELFNNNSLSNELHEKISVIGDLERLISKAVTTRINPRECELLKDSLKSLKFIKENCIKSKLEELNSIGERINICQQLYDYIESKININPPFLINKGGVIRNGVDSELDNLREIKNSGKQHLKDMLEQEIKRTGISSLKISYNNVFGYYFEVRNTHKDKVPSEWIRKQTLVNAERYITSELKEYEVKIFSAEEKIISIEFRIFADVVKYISKFIDHIQINSQLVAELDCLLSFSIISKKNKYYKPSINTDDKLVALQARHPVIEQNLEIEDEYIPNDLYLDRESQQIIMITGPNMSGKSAILRQTALIVLMAQIGCFVPAKKSEIGIVDKIFTRVGASDNISMGESTFMVEMNETASILNNISEKSLILLDEIGRGTSTYDGISIAWSIAEYLHEHPTKPKTLFATHYHELNEMSNQFLRIKNFNVSVKENNNEIIFMRKLIEGGSEHSFGIHVARMAGMPKWIIKNSKKILNQLESDRKKSTHKISTKINNDMQLSFVQLSDPILEEIRDELNNLEIDNLTPIEALMKLNEIKKIIG